MPLRRIQAGTASYLIKLPSGVVAGQQLLRAVTGRPGLIAEEKVLRLLIQYAPNHPETPRKYI